MFVFFIHCKLDKFKKLPSNFDGYGSLSVSLYSMTIAKIFFKRLFSSGDKIKLFYRIMFKSIFSLNENGNVVFEYWNKTGKITIYFNSFKHSDPLTILLDDKEQDLDWHYGTSNHPEMEEMKIIRNFLLR